MKKSDKFNELLRKDWCVLEERRENDCHFYVWCRTVRSRKNGVVKQRIEHLVTPTKEEYTWLKKSDVIRFSEYIEKQVNKLPLFEFVDESSEQEFHRYSRLRGAAFDFYELNRSISKLASKEEVEELIDSWTSLLELFYSYENREVRRRYYKYLVQKKKRNHRQSVVNNPNFNKNSIQHNRHNQDNKLPTLVAEQNTAYQQVARLKNSKHPDLIKMRVEYDRANQTLYLAAKNSKQISMRFDDLEKLNNYFEKPRVVSGLSEDEQAAVDTHKRLAPDIIEMVEGGIADERLALKWIALYKHWDKNKTRFRKALDAIRKYTNG